MNAPMRVKDALARRSRGSSVRPRKGVTVMMRVPVKFQRLVCEVARLHQRSAVEQLRVLVDYVDRKRSDYPGYPKL
jgi:hypothetical protein